METGVYLERTDRAENMARYYRLTIVETLFGDWAMVREWGRIGRHGQSREHWCTTKDDEAGLLRKHHLERLNRGYREA